MIKGINRQIIEVTDTQNEYFERALLVVRPGCSELETDCLREQAHQLLRTSGGYGGLRLSRRRQRIRRFLFAGASGLTGLVAGLAITGILK